MHTNYTINRIRAKVACMFIYLFFFSYKQEYRFESAVVSFIFSICFHIVFHNSVRVHDSYAVFFFFSTFYVSLILHLIFDTVRSSLTPI